MHSNMPDQIKPQQAVRIGLLTALLLSFPLISGCSRDAQATLPAERPNSGPLSAATDAVAAIGTDTQAQGSAAKSAGAADSADFQQALSDAYVVKRVLEIDGPFRHGDYVWDDEGVPDGPMVITVDLKAETLSVFKGGYEIGAAVILFGADEKPTPTGVYPITQKDADHVSNLYGSPMPYMLRMTNDGISVHGSEVDWGYATHGCVGVPVAFAKKLFGAVKLGDKIIVTDGETLKAGQAITAI